jgi:acetyl-CoA C-acetyltransferase
VSIDPRTPVIVGAAQVVRHEGGDECEPAAMMVEALRVAAQDSGAGERLLLRADSVRCVPVLGWRYGDAAALVAADLGAHPHETVQSAAVGGDGSQLLLNDTARAIAAGEIEVALVGGAEAVAAMRDAQRSGMQLRWRRQEGEQHPTRTVGSEREPLNAEEARAGLAAPVHTYALFESALQAGSGEHARSHTELISRLWSRFSAVAADNPHAWIKRSYTPDEIATPSRENRPIASPYSKLLTANMQVNMASGLIVCSAQTAAAVGVPKDRWVFMIAGAQAHDVWHVSERCSLAASPAIRAVGRAALEHAGLAIDEVAQLDLYSCFPSAVQIAARELGVAANDSARPLTVTGGLTFAGGPGNNYSAHGVATLVARLREQPDCHGLATAIGWYLTKHALGVYSGREPARRFASIDALPDHPPTRRVRARYDGPATLEACTVVFDRGGAPTSVIAAALTPDGDRALVHSTQADVARELCDGEAIGLHVQVSDGEQLSLADHGPSRKGAGVDKV